MSDQQDTTQDLAAEQAALDAEPSKVEPAEVVVTDGVWKPTPEQIAEMLLGKLNVLGLDWDAGTCEAATLSGEPIAPGLAVALLKERGVIMAEAHLEDVS